MTARHPKTSQLGHELYELLEAAQGATTDEIQTKPTLMRLVSLWPDVSGADEDAVAAFARLLIEQTTYALDKPDSERALNAPDCGAGTRILLALEPGTKTLPLMTRRARAAPYLQLRVRSMTRVRLKYPSPEMRLMEDVADRLRESSLDYVGADANGPTGPPHRSSLEAPETLAAVHNVWTAVNGILLCLVDVKVDKTSDNPAIQNSLRGLRVGSLAYFAYLHSLIHGKFSDEILNRPGNQFSNDAPLDRLPTVEDHPRYLAWYIEAITPFSDEEMDQLYKAINCDGIIEKVGSRLPDELVQVWMAWLNSCRCDGPANDLWCEVNRFCTALLIYREELETVWRYLQNPVATPAAYTKVIRPTDFDYVQSLMARLAIRWPPPQSNLTFIAG